MARPQNAISNSLEDFQGGSLYPGGTGKIMEFKYVLWDYDGKRPPDSQIAIFCKFQPTDGSNEGKEELIHWSVGPASDFQPSPDGGFLIPTGVRTTQSSSSNWAFVLKNMRDNCGLEMDKINGDSGLRAIEGSEVTFVRIDQPTRDGLERDAPQEGKRQNKPTILAPTRAKWAWEAKGGRSASTPTASSAASRATMGQKATPAANSTVTDATDPAEVIAFILEQSGGSIETSALPKAIANAMVNADKTVRMDVMKKAKADIDEIAAMSGWTLDNGKLSL